MRDAQAVSYQNYTLPHPSSESTDDTGSKMRRRDGRARSAACLDQVFDLSLQNNKQDSFNEKKIVDFQQLLKLFL